MIGRTLAGAPIDTVVNNKQGKVIVRTVTDYPLHSAAELTHRCNAELARLSYPARWGIVRVFQFPFRQRVARHLSWTEAGTFVGSELDGQVAPSLSFGLHKTKIPRSLSDISGQNGERWGRQQRSNRVS